MEHLSGVEIQEDGPWSSSDWSIMGREYRPIRGNLCTVNPCERKKISGGHLWSKNESEVHLLRLVVSGHTTASYSKWLYSRTRTRGQLLYNYPDFFPSYAPIGHLFTTTSYFCSRVHVVVVASFNFTNQSADHLHKPSWRIWKVMF